MRRLRKGLQAFVCVLFLIGGCTLAACGLSGCNAGAGTTGKDVPAQPHQGAGQAGSGADAADTRGEETGGDARGKQDAEAAADTQTPADGDQDDAAAGKQDGAGDQSAAGENAAPRWDTLACDGSTELKYAGEFSVDHYGDYRLITIDETDRYLLVPDGEQAPEGLPDDIAVIAMPTEHIYLVSSSVMDFFISLDALPSVRLSGTKESSWHLEEARAAMESGAMLYAGKYSAPDYELILDDGCELAIENTMIYHNPEVKEQLERLGIPVLVEHSSYESHPLGRLEWIKLYGALLGRENEAQEIYDRWLAELEPVLTQQSTGKTVAFFYITKNGAVSVRKSGDYIAKMIELAGGSYALSDLAEQDENALSTMNIQMEEFYAAARDADFLIYNSTIDEELHSLEELFEKSDLLGDFRAVKEGQVYCTGKNFFQETTGMGQFIIELHGILTGDKTQTKFLHPLK